MSAPTRRRLATGSLAAAALGAGAYLGLVTGAVPIDLGVGRRLRPLGPISIDVAAPRQVLFDVIAAPYGERPTRAMREKVQVLERGTDLVLAAHYTPIRGRLRATTVETVLLDPPRRFEFRLVRGPVPHVVETFDLQERDGGTRLIYTGELGTDLWALGEVWGRLVAKSWEATVRASLDAAKTEAERLALR